MAVLSFSAMYLLMYMMVDSYANVFPNLNEFYMAAMMTSPMILIELWLMGRMYADKRLSRVIGFLSIALFVASIVLLRNQIGISDQEFVRSMIPHHAAALLMCERSKLTDQELKTLCRNIVANQQAEILEMKAVLERLQKKSTESWANL